ncbi:MAG: hypothetical protein VX501_04275 [Pseudomonadota bacterium]|nr:hypothetical protein [Pseudomonadota bacterium]
MRITLSLVLAAGLAACSAPDNEMPEEDTPVEAAQAETEAPAEDAAEDAPAAPPGTDIYLYALNWDGDTPSLGEPVGRIGSEGYDNQPFFTNDGGVLYTSAGENGNTDIWRHDLVSGDSTQLTDTLDASEYSPKIPPAEGALSYLYQPPGGYAGNAYLAGDGNADPRAAHALAPVGYYEFSADMRYVATFYLGDPEGDGPFTLQLIDRSTSPETVTQIAENPGRTFWRNPRGTGVYHSIADANGQHSVHYLDYASADHAMLFPLPADVQDFVSAGLPTDDVAFLSSSDGQLVYWDGDNWAEAGDISALSGATRLAISPDRSVIAIVAEE